MALLAHFAKAEGPFQLTALAYGLAFLAYLASLWAPAFRDGRDRIHLAARGLFLAGLVLNAYLLIGRGVDTGRPPFKTYYEALLCFAFLFGLAAFLVERRGRARLLGVLSLAILLGALAFALHKQDLEPVSLPPSLNSGWFLPHAAIYLSAYASVSVAFVLGLLALGLPGSRAFEPGSFWARALGAEGVDFEKLHRKWLRLGFLLLAAGLVTGALWARLAWADVWAWDPKENLGLVTLLVYGAVLHMHYAEGWRGRRLLWGSVLAWGLVLLAFFGMGFLPTRGRSMHRYLEPPRPGEARDLNGIHPRMY
ncbi:MAG TPA: cytochrome c biogenesis protein CcsA [Holophagaceae bacterium]|nr:cytochrome c biogenesis protein CcsA [Holophagaceae bacterium]